MQICPIYRKDWRNRVDMYKMYKINAKRSATKEFGLRHISETELLRQNYLKVTKN